MRYFIEFDKPVKPNKALLVWKWLQYIENWSTSDTIKFCYLTREIGFEIIDKN